MANEKGMVVGGNFEFRGINENEFEGKVYYSVKIEQGTYDMLCSVDAGAIELVKTLEKGKIYPMRLSLSQYQGKIKAKFIGLAK